MLSDFSYVFYYWLVIFGIGLAFYPLSSYLFSKFWDRGYIFSKILGIGVTSYLVWVLASLKIAPFSRLTIVLVVLVLAALNWGVWYWKHHTSGEYFAHPRGVQDSAGGHSATLRVPKPRGRLGIFLWQEGLFFLGLLIWSYIRGFQPDINGLEKFMDYGFVNSILLADYFPPKDMWLAGENYINYYYFGHYVCAFLTKLTGIASEITYNLQLGLIFGLSIVGAFSLVSNFLYQRFGKLNIKVFLGAIIGSLLLNLGGNLHTVVYVFKKGISTYWYPDATRFIPYTIHEFPSYSYVVADLHGHFSDIPFVLLNIGLIFCLYLALNKIKGGFFWEFFDSREKKIFVLPLVLILFIGFFLAICAMTNSWDLPIYIMLAGLAYLAARVKFGFGRRFWVDLLIFGFLLVGLYLFFGLPFNFHFEPFFKGIAKVEARSPFYMLAILWGYFYFFAISLIYLIFGRRIKNIFSRRTLIEGISRYLDIKIKVLGTAKRKIEKLHVVDVFLIIMVGLSSFLIIFPEFFYVKDIYIKDYHRANTMFKLTYQSFMMLSMVAGYTLVFVLVRKKALGRGIWLVIASFMLASVLVYPYFAVGSYYNKLRNYRGLDGISYLKDKYPGDYEAIMWLRENVKDGVIVEAVGESYTDYGRISSYTGIQTILGWPVHEWLWRGSYDEAGKRTGEVAAIYTGDLATAKNFLKTYGVDYVIVGKLEKDKYSKINEVNFKKLGKMVFEEKETRIYKLR